MHTNKEEAEAIVEIPNKVKCTQNTASNSDDLGVGLSPQAIVGIDIRTMVF